MKNLFECFGFYYIYCTKRKQKKDSKYTLKANKVVKER